MNNTIRAHFAEKLEKNPTAGTWEQVKLVDDLTEAGITLEDCGIAGTYGAVVLEAVMKRHGMTSPMRPTLEYMNYMRSVKAEAAALYPRKTK